MAVKGGGEMSIKCPQCHAENREDSKFCSKCAAPLAEGDRLADSLKIN
jgi:uncharacterized membrane protein YvbJ